MALYMAGLRVSLGHDTLLVFLLHRIACNIPMLFVKLMSMHTTYTHALNDGLWLGNGHQKAIVCLL